MSVDVEISEVHSHSADDLVLGAECRIDIAVMVGSGYDMGVLEETRKKLKDILDEGLRKSLAVARQKGTGV